MGRPPPWILRRTIDRIALRTDDLPAHSALRRIGSHALRPQVASEFCSPSPQGRLAYMQALSLLTHCLHHCMHMRMGLIGVEHERIAMLEPELFSQEIPRGRLDRLRRRASGHREDEFVHELWW